MTENIVIPAAEWPEIAQILEKSGQAWPGSAAEADWVWWCLQRSQGRVRELPGRPTLRKRWHWTGHRIIQFLKTASVSRFAPRARAWPEFPGSEPPPEAFPRTGAPIGGPGGISTVSPLPSGATVHPSSMLGSHTPESREVIPFPARAELASACSARPTMSQPSECVPQRFSASYDQGPEETSQETGRPAWQASSPASQQALAMSETAHEPGNGGWSAASSASDPRDGRGGGPNFDSQPAGPARGADRVTTDSRQDTDRDPSTGGAHSRLGSTNTENYSAFSQPVKAGIFSDGPATAAASGTAVDISSLSSFSSSFSSLSSFSTEGKKEQEESPTGDGSNRHPVINELVRLLKRWSGQEAPKARRWLVRVKDDLEWFLLEIPTMTEAIGLDLIDVLKSWDEWLEKVAHSTDPEERVLFPKFWKTALRKQIQNRARWLTRQKERADERGRSREGTRLEQPSGDHRASEARGDCRTGGEGGNRKDEAPKPRADRLKIRTIRSMEDWVAWQLERGRPVEPEDLAEYHAARAARAAAQSGDGADTRAAS